MAKTDTTIARAPRGTKPVMQAFFTALESVPEASRAAVSKAAYAMIRDEMKTRREKLKAAAAKEKEKARAPAKTVAAEKAAPKVDAPPAKAAKPNGAAPTPKRRARKTAEAPTEA